MNIVPIRAFKDNYIWSMINEKNKDLICVDPGESEPLLDFLKAKGLKLRAILLTHHHADHIGGTSDLAKLFPKTPIFGPKDTRIPTLTNPISEQDLIDLDPFHFKVLEIPGHTSTHICYIETNLNWLFCGDTLFSAGCGRVFDGTIEQLHASIEKLKQLKDDTKVFCGHEYTLQNLRFARQVEPENQVLHQYLQELNCRQNLCSLPSTIAFEKQINPFFRTQESALKKFAKARGCQGNDSLSVFATLRAEKDRF